MFLHIENLVKKRLQDKQAGFILQAPSFVIRAGDKILLSGPSGSGKSTLLDMLGLVLRPDEGAKFVLNLADKQFDLMELWRKGQLERLAWLRRHMGYVLQTGGLLPYLSARQNIALAFRGHGKSEYSLLRQISEELGIDHLLDKPPARLSVGERQRVAIARAIVGRPDFLLADEPTAALDPAHADRVMAIFTRIVAELKLTLFLVTHDVAKVPEGFRHFIIESDSPAGANLNKAVVREARLC